MLKRDSWGLKVSRSSLLASSSARSEDNKCNAGAPFCSRMVVGILATVGRFQSYLSLPGKAPRWFWASCFVLFLPVGAQASYVLESLAAKEKKGFVVLEASFDRAYGESEIIVNQGASPQSLIVELPNSGKTKNLVIEKDTELAGDIKVKSEGSNALHLNIDLPKQKNVKSILQDLKVESSGQNLVLTLFNIDQPRAGAASPQQNHLEKSTAQRTPEKRKVAVPIALKVHEADFKKVDSTFRKQPPISETAAALNEENVALNLEEPRRSPVEGISLQKISWFLAALFVLGIIGLWATRRWLQKAGGVSKGHTIKVIATQPIGPKKNITLLSVAGEGVLIGVTEQNISLLKTISLLDDEFPDEVNPSFNGALYQSSDDDYDEGGEEDDGFAVRDITNFRNQRGEL